jgi:pimeloyl-ACP methyl ester carboxylesterase
MQSVKNRFAFSFTNSRAQVSIFFMKRVLQLLSAFLFVTLSGCGALDSVAFKVLYPFEVVMKTVPEKPMYWKPPEGAEKIRLSDGGLAWFRKAEKPDHVVLYLHGNGETLWHLKKSGLLNIFTSFGWTWIVIDYPSLGVGPQSVPSQETITRHATEAFKTAAQFSQGVLPISVVGRSLGAAVASQVALLEGLHSLTLISPWTSFKDVAEDRNLHRLVSKKFHMEHEWNSFKACEKFPKKTMIVHGYQDELIPYKFGKKMSECSDAEFLSVGNAGHNDLFAKHPVLTKINSFIREK